MRGIPFRIICLLGMQDGSFPRNPSPLTFDLMANKPKYGDPSQRDDDRYLFLEFMLCARSRLYLSYVGQSIRDNSLRPPSVVVSELQDFVSTRCRLQGTITETGIKEMDPEIIRSLLVTRHCLHPFSPSYFCKPVSCTPHLFSFSSSNARIGQALLERSTQALDAFLNKQLEEPGPELKSVTIEILQIFYRNPSKFFVTNRLEYNLPSDNDLMEDNEPFALSKLDEFPLKQAVLDLHAEGKSLPDLVSIWKQRGLLPPASAGIISGNDIIQSVLPQGEEVKRLIGGAMRISLKVDLSIKRFHLEGELQPYDGVGIVFYRPSHIDRKKKPQMHLDIWIQHLALQLSEWTGPKISHLVGDDECWVFTEVKGAEDLLERLLETYWQGLTRPLPFFPRSSMSFNLQPKGASKLTAQERALAVWEGMPESDYSPEGEKEDPYFRLCFGNHPNPLDDQFQDLAQRIYSPMLNNQEEK
jgi:exodeoxyribonuclease V gamma subunit